MRIAEIIKLLASPPSPQSDFLGPLPDNVASEGYSKINSVRRMAILYLASTSIHEGDGGSEGEASWLARTQLPRDLIADKQHPFWQSLSRLSTALQMLMTIDKPFFFTLHGLRTAHEWKLIRHLASEVCQCTDWPPTLRSGTFEELWNELGADVVDETEW